MLAAIRPAGKEAGVWALPKGNIARGEKPDATAVREVAEETGLEGKLDQKLGDVRYVYTWAGERPEQTAAREVAEETGAQGRVAGKLGDVRYVYTWDGERIFKVVSFYLLRYSRGRLGNLPPETAHEVAETRWLPLEEGTKLLAYKGEREMAAKALARLGSRA